MDLSLTGVTHLVENDLLEILREHFGKFGYGFKMITFGVDLVERDKPRFEIDLKLDYIGKRQGKKKRVDKLYDELMEKCTTSIKVDIAIMEQIYKWVKEGYISKEEFIELIEKVKGA